MRFLSYPGQHSSLPAGSAGLHTCGEAVTPAQHKAESHAGTKACEAAHALARLGYSCDTVTRFQERYGLSPVDGVAGPATGAVAERPAASDPAACEAEDYGLTACVDLTHRTSRLMRGGQVVHGPVPIRSGMAGYATPAGRFDVQWKAARSWSVPYKVWLPYWEAFNNDTGFHETTTTYRHNAAAGSHGCINLLHSDALVYWDELDEGTPVNVFGHRPTT